MIDRLNIVSWLNEKLTAIGRVAIVAFLIGSFHHKNNAQCPAAFTCETSDVLCSIDAINGFTCINSTILNTSFPFPTLCFGAGVPHNLNWWAFIGNGGALNLTFNFNPPDCGLGHGMQAGVFQVSCDGSQVWECDASCNTSTFSLSGSTQRCETYYVWVDGCNGDVCTYTMSVNGNGGPSYLPDTLPEIVHQGSLNVCQEVNFHLPPLQDGCMPTLEWFVNGKPEWNNYNQWLDYTIPDSFSNNQTFEVCVTATIGNPATPGGVCDQNQTCKTFTAKIDTKIGPLLQVPVDSQPFSWNGILITSSCINPPCSARVKTKRGYCVDSIQPIMLLSKEKRSILKGVVYFDENKNCAFDSTEIGAQRVVVEIIGQTYQVQVRTDLNGNYMANVPLGTYDIHCISPTSGVIACPDTASLTMDVRDSIYCQDFFLPDTICSRTSIRFRPLTGRNRPRCDMRRRYIRLDVVNVLPDTIYGEKVTIHTDSLIQFTHSNVTFNLVSPMQIEVLIDTLLPRQVKQLRIYFTPVCDGEDTWKEVCLKAFFSDERRCNDNIIKTMYCDIIRNSNDPNDLTVTPLGVKEEKYVTVGTKFQGLIRFHNNGSDTAYDINVELELDDQPFFDIEKLKIVDASFPLTTILTEGDQIFFEMFDIKLPHNAIDSINSHGYIVYEVPVAPYHRLFEKMYQTAHIYFDHNPPVTTNTEWHTLAPDYIYDEVNSFFLCPGDLFRGQAMWENRTIRDTSPTMPGLITRNLIKILPVYDVVIDTTILAGDTFMGVRIITDTIWIEDYKTKDGCDSIVTYNIDAIPVSTSDIHLDHDVYPNPAQSGLVYFDLKGEKAIHGELIDGLGRQTRVSLEQNGNVFKADLSDIPDGTYLYRIKVSEGKMMVGKLIMTP